MMKALGKQISTMKFINDYLEDTGAKSSEDVVTASFLNKNIYNVFSKEGKYIMSIDWQKIY